ncbi:MAG: type I methionyl aminopeptidase [Proteobacteria bacterium]|nr:type I methionyl aminopeptidase [Pseudomonadota bacterium]
MHKHSNCCDHDHDHDHDHHQDESPHEDPRDIKIYQQTDFEHMRKAGRLASQVLDYVTPYIKAGITTDEIDKLCHDFIIQHGATPSPLGYHGYPKSVCTSINHVVCHGIPSNKKLQIGDIMNLDVTVNLNGWHGDTSRMFAIGKVGILAQKLIDTTYEAMMRGIEVVKPGATLGDIGHAIQSFVEKKGFSVVRDFCGHGVGEMMHMAPQVPHFGKSGQGIELKEGMFFTIEPMINAGKYAIKVLDDGWTAVTRDKSLSAQFEHSIGVTATGYEIFTVS